MPCFHLVGDPLTVFQSALFFLLNRFAVAYTNISLSDIRKQHINMRSCCLQMSDAIIHITYDYDAAPWVPQRFGEGRRKLKRNETPDSQ